MQILEKGSRKDDRAVSVQVVGSLSRLCSTSARMESGMFGGGGGGSSLLGASAGYPWHRRSWQGKRDSLWLEDRRCNFVHLANQLMCLFAIGQTVAKQ